MSQEIMNLVEQASTKEEVPFFEVGDTVDVHTEILEGDKKRTQVFTGTVIARSGSGPRELFTVRRIVAGVTIDDNYIQYGGKSDVGTEADGKPAHDTCDIDGIRPSASSGTFSARRPIAV